jgi:purine-binding chemotaxis protein CheW
LNETQNELIKVIVFQLQNEEYAIRVKHVSAIERIQAITRVPATSAFIKGVINLRGVIVPIIDLRLRFRMEEKEVNEETRMIIVKSDNMEVGLIVDAASDVMDLPKEKIEPNPEVIGEVSTDYIEGVTHIDQRLIILLDLKKVLTNKKEELANVKDG